MTTTYLFTATAATLLALATPVAQAAEPAADASGQPAVASSNSPDKAEAARRDERRDDHPQFAQRDHYAGLNDRQRRAAAR